MNTIVQVRNKQPLIHHLTNQVVMNFTANGLLAFGGSPVMAKEVKEAAEMAKIANGVLINIGTITEKDIDAMIQAGITANPRGIPVVLDPVGVAATSFRKQVMEQLTNDINFTAIKGNIGEMAYLVDIAWETKGVDSAEIYADQAILKKIAQQVAEKYQTIAIVTGAVDIISQGETIQTNDTGHDYLTNITGAGCLLGSIVTACLTTDTPHMDAAYDALFHYGKAAERAAALPTVSGPGTFLPHFIDQLGK